MNGFLFGIRDWWGRWSVDRAGVETGEHPVREVRAMLDAGEIDAHTWLRHYWTRRYSLVGEVLRANAQATEAEYEAWFPNPRTYVGAATPP